MTTPSSFSATANAATAARAPGTPNAPLVELKQVHRTFIKDRKLIPVLQDINLSVYPNEIICLVGESGCGKTTTGKIIAGLLDQSQGEVLVHGQPRGAYQGAQRSQLRRDFQIVHQDPFASLNPAHTIEQILSFPLRRHGKVNSRSQLRRRIWELLTLVDLTPPGDIVNKYPHQLSGGQRQRVSIARSLTVDPRLIVADEAVSMVDVSIRIGILKMLQGLRDRLNMAIVFITHDLALAKYFAWEGRIAVMYLGRIVEIGRTPDVIDHPAHPYTRALLAAVPEADPDITRRKQPMKLRSDDIPRLTEIPPGCAFHPRCPFFVAGQCDHDVPRLSAAHDFGQVVACTPLTTGGALTLVTPTPTVG
jgi:peptide/nickel transport system ATP-binding protein